MIGFFRYKWLTALGCTAAAAFLSMLLLGGLDLRILAGVFLASFLVCSIPAINERRWHATHLPPDAVHVPVRFLFERENLQLLRLFDLPKVYPFIRNRYSLKSTDAAAPGIFLYIYLPTELYEMRNVGPEAIYRHLAAKLKDDLNDPQDLDLIAQRGLPLALGFRFLPKNGFAFHELSQFVSVVRRDYVRENTRVRGVLQSKQRVFRLHAPEDSEWRTFRPYLDDSHLLHGGVSLSHDFKSGLTRSVQTTDAAEMESECVRYPEPVPFGSLLTYAKKGEIALAHAPDVKDKLFIDRVNVLVNGPEQRGAILAELSRVLRRELTEEDFYPLFNYTQKLVGSLPTGKTVTDCISSHGNFALYYDREKGWTVVKLQSGLPLQIQEAYWSEEPKPVATSVSLTTSRCTLITGPPDSPLQFQISTGTPTRGQIFAADEMIEGKIQHFAQIHGYRLLDTVGSGAEGCLYLGEKQSRRFYLKSPDGSLAAEEIQTIETLKKNKLIPENIHTYEEERMIVMPEYPSPLADPTDHTLASLLFQYLKDVWAAGYLCLDLTPEHVKMQPGEEKIFLIDFSGYVSKPSFQKNPKEFIADRKKIEYRTPEEFVTDFRDAEKFQIYLLGLLLFQFYSSDHNLPMALTKIKEGTQTYSEVLSSDLSSLNSVNGKIPFSSMLAYDPAQRKNFSELQSSMNHTTEDLRAFWSRQK